ncbi:MAG: glycosyltransferase family 4 protein [Turicibacter sp.]|nr:glycosyltransferase family 4 protein [Turicibacter sp.]
MKVGYLISTLENCGPVNILYNIVKYLDKSKFEPIIITLSPENAKTRIHDFEALGIKVIPLNLSRVEGIFKARQKVKELVAKHKIQILHGQSFRADKIIANVKSVKTVNTIHNYPFLDFVMTYGKVMGTVMAWQHTQTIKKLDVPIACSKSVAKLFNKNKGLKLKSIQNGVDTEVFHPIQENEKVQIRQKLDLSVNKKIFLVVGVLTGRKDPLTIIEAFNKRNQNDEILLFFGEGDLDSECKKSAQNRNIIFKGRVNNVSEYLQAADYYISAALAEGLPNTVLEALATGIPTVLSAIGPHEEIVGYENSLQPFLFEPGNAVALNESIEGTLHEDIQSLKGKALALIREHLSADKMTKQYEAVYESLG